VATAALINALDLATGAVTMVRTGWDDELEYVYSPDGTRLASASRDGTVRVWDVGNGRELTVYRGHEAAKFDDEEAKPEKASDDVANKKTSWVSKAKEAVSSVLKGKKKDAPKDEM
jgi:WD40 repeat protein